MRATLLTLMMLGTFGLEAFANPVQLGPRPYYLVDQMAPSALKDELMQCADTKRTFRPSDFSIGHRGAPLQS